MRPSEALRMHREEALAIIAKYPVSNPRVFGSVARGHDVEGSDIDIVVDMDAPLSYFDMARIEFELRDLLGCPVDLGVFRNLKSEIAQHVMKDIRPL